MGESDIALHDDEALNFELPDRCLRASGEEKLGGPACSHVDCDERVAGK
jgi:hypothetical protein